MSMQMPYREQDLLTVSGFVSYCRDNGVRTDRSELEYFTSRKFLLPAIRVLVGYTEFRKVRLTNEDGEHTWRYIYADDLDAFEYSELDETSYYDRGTLHHGGKGWLEWYADRDMTKLPSQEEYVDWKKFATHSRGTNPKDYEEACELMYDKRQIYLLKHLQNRRSIVIRNEGLEKDDVAWVRSGSNISSIFNDPKEMKALETYATKWHKFFAFHNDAIELLINRNEQIRQNIATFSDSSSEGEIQKDINATTHHHDNEEKNIAKLRQLIVKHDFTIEQIGDWRSVILQEGSFSDIHWSKYLKQYLMKLDEGTLEQAEDAYKIVNQLSWFLHILGEEELYSRQMILRTVKNTCAYCSLQYIPIRSAQVTCGKKACKYKQRNDQRKAKRRAIKNKTI